MGNSTQRLRRPPRQRFQDGERRFDLDAAFRELRRQSVEREGHIQKALYRYGRTTTAIFAFAAGAGLESYRLDGEAIMHVIRGRMRVETKDGVHELGPNQILLLAPDVPQSLTALEPTHLLVTFVGEP